jgi:hypothetical protein
LVGETLGQQVDQFTPLFKSCAAKITTTQFVKAWGANTALLALNVFAGPALRAVGDWMFGAEQGEVGISEAQVGTLNPAMPGQLGNTEAPAVANNLATGPNCALFWCGLGEGGAERAAEWAAQNGRQTLEMTLESNGISLPVWDASNPAVVAAWRQASMDFAAGASGDVVVLQGDELRLGAIWKDEFSVLQANPSVTSITSINPETGAEVLLWQR